ncbi:PREDICTED: zinc finger CCCH domain-containing protein 14 isoform X3 [Ficedula albicollis]|uniref:zinc finger CCCH domain-containing protein 14 isoform X3 n=1 Tax=Ficedula albicollis TaxID=59894 RepID=UPI0007AD7CA5|nr:PREDICTED: zinc finger CCCH domain-containing protein 14 isoform X3 [Ficedula albicollis]
MVMVANKKSQEQMTEDLSLFLGNNTVRFTVWLHGVLDKLRSVTTEPTSVKSSESNIFESNLPSSKSSSCVSDERRRGDILPPLAVSSTRTERNDSRVSTSSQEQRNTASKQSCEDGSASRLTSTVKPLRELSPSEAVIDIKPEPDDLIDEDLNFVQENPLSRKKPIVTVTYGSSRPSAEIYRPPAVRSADGITHVLRLSQQGSLQGSRQLDTQGCRSLETGQMGNPEAFGSLAEGHRPTSKLSADKVGSEEESSRKRRLPVVSSVVKVKKFCNDGEDEEEEEDYGLRTGSISSSVSVPAKPERRPSLPPSKQANKNLILKAISEAQESVTKTTNFSTGNEQKELSCRLQIDPMVEDTLQVTQDYCEPESVVHSDTRSFILKKPKLPEDMVPQNQQLGKKGTEAVRVHSGRLIQTRDQLVQPEKPASPKFIVTLDGVPSPPGYLSDQEEEDSCIMEGLKPITQHMLAGKGLKGLQAQQMQIVTRQLENCDVEMEDLSMLQKQEKVLERCKYWPACKNGDECVYHHPTLPCKVFPNCKFADKCLFIHPNCKYDAKCTKPDCPYTHASRRSPHPSPKPAPLPTLSISSSSPLCKFFPACKKMECPFYHPKHCRFNTQCTRPDCTFYHPTVAVPPRHALKWTRTQISE